MSTVVTKRKKKRNGRKKKTSRNKRSKTNSSAQGTGTSPSNSSSSTRASTPTSTALDRPVEGIQRQIALLRWMYIIEAALKAWYQGLHHEKANEIEECFKTIRARFKTNETWCAYLACCNVSDGSKLEVITLLATIRINHLTQQKATKANQRMKDKNGGVYFKPRN